MRSSQTAAVAARPMSAEEKKVIFASSLGTVFEWYDFYLYGSLAAIIAKQFFSGLDEGSAFIFALLAFAAPMPGQHEACQRQHQQGEQQGRVMRDRHQASVGKQGGSQQASRPARLLHCAPE